MGEGHLNSISCANCIYEMVLIKDLMLSVLSALDRRCDAVLEAWCVNEDGWESMSAVDKSAARTLMHLMENVFRKYFEYSDQDGVDEGLITEMMRSVERPDMLIEENYHVDCALFFLEIRRYMQDPQRYIGKNGFNGICPVMNLKMTMQTPGTSGYRDFVIEEIGIRPCALGFPFLENLLCVIVESLMGINNFNTLQCKLIIKSLGVRGALVQDILDRIGFDILQSGSAFSMRNEWVVSDEKLREFHDNLAKTVTIYKYETDYPNNLQLNDRKTNIGQYDSLVNKLVTRSPAIKNMLYLMKDDIKSVTPVFQLETNDLLVFRNGAIKQYGERHAKR